MAVLMKILEWIGAAGVVLFSCLIFAVLVGALLLIILPVAGYVVFEKMTRVHPPLSPPDHPNRRPAG